MPKPPAPCGTISAYRRHLRHNEPVDEECQQAARDQKNERAAKKREESRVTVDEETPGGEMDEAQELRRMYQVLQAHMAEAPPQSIAAIVRQADAILVRLKEVEGSQETVTGGLLDGVPLPSNVTRLPGTHVAS